VVEALRLDELGSVQFAQLCRELVGAETAAGAEVTPWGFAAVCREGVATPDGAALPGPTLVLALWLRGGSDADVVDELLQHIVREAAAASPVELTSVLLLTNVPAPVELAGLNVALLGPDELWALVREQPSLRYRLPFLLGVAEPSLLLPDEARERSTGDVDAAVALARVFVPTRAYELALTVLEQRHFVVLSGPPEMGKTAIARIVGLAALSDGWELHECVRPEDLWQRFSRERRQLFVADDAFGSTEYRPETAERWAVELDQVLRALDDRHRLIWTSRPTPLHAALRRIHREHGVERFPQPAQIAIDAAELEIAEKALILFRHTKAVSAPEAQVEIVRDHGFEIVSHPHFTPERIRRFCSSRLMELAASPDAAAVAAVVAAEIREPTTAMAASYHALGGDHKAVLHALVDTHPGPVSRSELTPASRRHAQQGLAQSVARIVDQLADHFLRTIGSDDVTWVHPSWRDLVIDELAGDREARQAFLRSCGIHGIALALSTAGGSGGERALPLLHDDTDWDALAGRLATILPTLDPPDVALLLESLAEALREATGRAGEELDSLAADTLRQLAQLWGTGSGPPAPVGLLAAWLSLAVQLPETPLPEQALAKAWIELLPGEDVDLATAGAVAALDDWLMLTELLTAHAPEMLDHFRFPGGQTDALRAVIDAAPSVAPALDDPARTLLVRVLVRISRLVPELAYDALTAVAFVTQGDRSPPQHEPEPELRILSPELEQLLALPLPSENYEHQIVARVLRDL
jgi:hypothetical protein